MKYILSYSDFLSLNEAVGTALKTFVEPGLITPDEWSSIQSIDPSRGKFSVPMIKWYLQTRNLPIIGRYIDAFWKLKNQNILKGVDLNKYSDFKDFTLLVDVYKYSAKTQAYKKFGEPSYEILQDDENIFLVRIKNLAASVYFGDESGWCIGDTKTYTVSKNYKEYGEKGAILYFIYDKKEPYESSFKKIMTAAFFDKTYEIKGISNAILGDMPLNELKKKGVNIKLLKGLSLNDLDLSRFSPSQIEFIKKFGFSKFEIETLYVSNGVLDLPELVIPYSNLGKLNILRHIPNDVKVPKNIVIDALHTELFFRSLLSYYNILKDYNIKVINVNDYRALMDYITSNNILKLKNLNIDYSPFDSISFGEIRGIKDLKPFSFLKNRLDCIVINVAFSDFEYLDLNLISDNIASIKLSNLPYFKKIDVKNTLSNKQNKISIRIYNCPNLDDTEIEKLRKAGYDVHIT